MSTNIPSFVITARKQVTVQGKINPKSFKVTNIGTEMRMDEITCELLCIVASTPAFWGHQNQACVKNLLRSPVYYQLQ
jgi:hypothetical protein